VRAVVERGKPKTDIPLPLSRCEEAKVVVYNKCEAASNVTLRPCISFVDQFHDLKATPLRNHGSYLDYILSHYGR
jgi:hypothetical protein